MSKVRIVKHDTVEFLFFFSLISCLPLGIALMLLWAKKIFPALLRRINARRDIVLSHLSIQAFAYMIPGLLLLILCSVPVFYFGNLRKQYSYCMQVVRVNEGISRNSPFLLKRCGDFDIDELFERHAAEAENRSDGGGG